jgi:multiple sugar transport system permease protein
MTINSDQKHTPMATLALVFVAIIWISPFSWLFVNAVDTQATGELRWPQSIGIGNFVSAMSGSAAQQFMNSMILALGTATMTIVVAAGAAYFLSRIHIPGKTTILWALVVMRMMPTNGVLVPIYFTAEKSGLLNPLGVMIALTILNLPFTLLLLKNFFDTVPLELEEAAHVEGASLWEILRHVVLPLSRAGIAVVWFFSFTSAWNEFLFPLIFSRTDSVFPMSMGLYSAFGEHGAIQYGFLAAYSIVYATPAIGVYFLLRRNMNTGFAGVGVKG